MRISDVHKNEANEGRRGSRSGLLILCQVAGEGLSEGFCVSGELKEEGGEMKGPEETGRLAFLHRGREGRKQQRGRQEGWGGCPEQVSGGRPPGAQLPRPRAQTLEGGPGVSAGSSFDGGGGICEGARGSRALGRSKGRLKGPPCWLPRAT